eukprot:CAMPEP_0117028218 /NCGR_PEP_ID=MMETSP0472-20121206/20534_1 /TAXON_ID=693140 ORGANISM="Tiarina fusus, Strain LIS" /NCGR_SAMPLE_ID=MMETSP0472 /ASSEMBLY_ACC=CAM_ASM_000603 /LENGTH=228 /DNA_ID=CAMNT_0004735639 /DNA_START=215 /DNA_END=901 /DNA_ORIENTATION=+
MKMWWLLPDAPSAAYSVSSGSSHASSSSSDAAVAATSKVVRIPKTRKSTIRFADNVTVKRPEKFMKAEEAASYWYDRSELQEILQEAIMVASSHEDKAFSIDANEYPYRGLEWISADNKKDAVINRSRQVVFNQQNSSAKTSKTSRKISQSTLQSRIAKLYVALTQESSMHARLMAMSDKLEADCYYLEMHDRQENSPHETTWRFVWMSVAVGVLSIVAVWGGMKIDI